MATQFLTKSNQSHFWRHIFNFYWFLKWSVVFTPRVPLFLLLSWCNFWRYLVEILHLLPPFPPNKSSNLKNVASNIKILFI